MFGGKGRRMASRALALLILSTLCNNLSADLLFYLDSPESLERPVDYQAMVGDKITVHFVLESTVGLRTARDFALQGEVEQWVLSPELFDSKTEFSSTALLETHRVASHQGFEYGLMALYNTQTGQIVMSEPFTSELEASLKIDDAKSVLNQLVAQHRLDGTESPWSLLWAHTHPSLFPLGTSDQSAARRFIAWVKGSHPYLSIASFYSVAISQNPETGSYYLFMQHLSNYSMGYYEIPGHKDLRDQISVHSQPQGIKSQ
jgi:hypothetical protein